MTDPEVFVVAMVLVGLAVGSFINVAASRIPRMMEAAWRAECMEITSGRERPRRSAGFDLIHPPSACPACGHRISALENIPVLSYVMLGGRCSACRWRIPARYPTVETFGALVAGAAALHFGVGIAAAGACLLGWGLLAASTIDFETRLLPDSITLPLLWLGLAFNVPGTFASLGDCVIGAMAGYGVLWSVHHGFRLATGREGMGYGDFKLLASLGAWLGWQTLPAIVLLASLASATIGIALAARGGAARDARLPFGPFLAVAGLLMLYCGDAITTMWYGFMTETP
ncbi:MAG: A24 family peptidase [Thiotrichales bacterium]|nr:A24 family peptidase [Thiotrichales bacterium]MCY4285139.1 A24 family peptidase [Thiotrichales bacterium]MCY4351024.1 A24 family peptidase [Thiotrichales bacterium]